ncbi:SDR family oxidoreductase [Nonomuraea ferruginea]
MPHRIVVLDALPLNHNGKADRKALAALIVAQTATQEGPAEPVEPPADPMEELVCSAWRDVLDLEQVSVVVPFSDYGGTSLLAYRLTAAISERLGKPVPPRDLLVASTVRAQAARLTQGVDDDCAELAYIRHDLAWSPPQTLLLTGATGFVGAHVLAELLTRSNAGLICLVRCADPADGARRLTEVLEQYGLTSAWQLLPTALKTGRVEVIPSDLGSELLGLPQRRFDAIASTVSGVVNAAGAVNFLSGYLDHRPANVLGVQEIIKLASGGARVHTLSTLSIFPPAGPDAPPVTEDRLPATEEVAADGYNRSKYVAESLLADAHRQGVRSVVYRLGEVWPHRATGVANPDSLAHNLLYACARTGCVFPTGAEIDVTPVDVVAEFVARAATGDIEVPDGAMHVLWLSQAALRRGVRRARRTVRARPGRLPPVPRPPGGHRRDRRAARRAAPAAAAPGRRPGRGTGRVRPDVHRRLPALRHPAVQPPRDLAGQAGDGRAQDARPLPR